MAGQTSYTPRRRGAGRLIDKRRVRKKNPKKPKKKSLKKRNTGKGKKEHGGRYLYLLLFYSARITSRRFFFSLALTLPLEVRAIFGSVLEVRADGRSDVELGTEGEFRGPSTKDLDFGLKGSF